MRILKLGFSAAFISFHHYYEGNWYILLWDIQDHTQEPFSEQAWKAGFRCQADGCKPSDHRGSSHSASLVQCISNPTLLSASGLAQVTDTKVEIPW